MVVDKGIITSFNKFRMRKALSLIEVTENGIVTLLDGLNEGIVKAKLKG